MSHQTKPPAYRMYQPKGRKPIACVDLPTTSGKRRVYLGAYDSPASREAYDLAISEWYASHRKAAPVAASKRYLQDATGDFVSPAAVAAAFLRHRRHTHRTGFGRFKGKDIVVPALRRFRDGLKFKNAKGMKAIDLELIQTKMVTDGLALATIREYMRFIRLALIHANKSDILPDTVYAMFAKVDRVTESTPNLKPAREVEPVDDATIEATVPHLPRHVSALVKLLRLTGARPKELCTMRVSDINMRHAQAAGCWIFQPKRHKTTHKGKVRIIAFGPLAQAILEPFIRSSNRLDSYVFSPAASEDERFGELIAAGKVKHKPTKELGECYTARVIRKAIERACRRAGVPAWHPYQLRHSAATAIRQQFGIEKAQDALGHSREDMTHRYAAKALANVVEIAKKVG